MKTITKISMVIVLTVILMESFVFAGSQNIFNVTTTANGNTTWDSDMINVEQVAQTGKGVYVAVLDTGLVPNWKDYFPTARVAANLGTGFYEELHWDPSIADFVQTGNVHQTTYIGSTSSPHGTHVTSTILGYFYRSNYDLYSGYNLPPMIIRGIAPDVTIIPVKVLDSYQIPADPSTGTPAALVNFGTDLMIAYGINYITNLAIHDPAHKYVISMSFGGPGMSSVEQAAYDNAIAHGVILVAAAGNEGTAGMGYPAAYSPIISVGASGWTGEWLGTNWAPYYRMWWLQSSYLPYNDIAEPTPVSQVYVADFSSRALPGQQLDVLAPGTWVRGPFPDGPGYSHLPWWSNGIADLVSRANPGNFFYLGGTSMATPHVSAVVALMLQKDPSLNQAQVESILKSTALPIPAGSATVFDIISFSYQTYSWGSDATGAGLIQANLAVAAA